VRLAQEAAATELEGYVAADLRVFAAAFFA
jgi:hypothetical protein